MYWIVIGLSFVSITDGNQFIEDGYTANVGFNDTDFSSDEIDSGGFFSGVIGIFTALGRFILFAGFGATPILTGLWQAIFSAWQIGWLTFTVGFIIDSVWSG